MLGIFIIIKFKCSRNFECGVFWILNNYKIIMSLYNMICIKYMNIIISIVVIYRNKLVLWNL